MREDAPQREYAWRDLFNALRYLTHTGCPWARVCQQWTRWRDARLFEVIVRKLNELQRVVLGHEATPTAIVLDGRVLQSTPESGRRASYDGGKRRKASTAHSAVDTLGQLAERGQHASQ